MTTGWAGYQTPILRNHWRKALTEKRWRVEEGPDKHGGHAFECFDTLDEAFKWITDRMPDGRLMYCRVIDTHVELKADAA